MLFGDFIPVAFLDGMAFFIPIFMPLGIIFLVAILFGFLARLPPLGFGFRCFLADLLLFGRRKFLCGDEGFARGGLGLHSSDGFDDVFKHRSRELRFRRWLPSALRGSPEGVPVSNARLLGRLRLRSDSVLLRILTL